MGVSRSNSEHAAEYLSASPSVEKDWLPAVVTMGVRETCTSMARVWAELASGAVVQVVDKRTGRRRAWIVPVLEDGYEGERVGCEELARRFGWYLEQVRDVWTFKVYDQHAGAVRGYVQWCPPDSIARLDIALQFAARRTRTGRIPVRNIKPLAVQAS